MDLETAVASVVAAEQIGSTPPEALKAQAVAARSFFIAARRRHRRLRFLRHDALPVSPRAARRGPSRGAGGARDGRPRAHVSRRAVSRVLFRELRRPNAHTRRRGAGRRRWLSVFQRGVRARRHAAGDRNGHGIGLCQERCGLARGRTRRVVRGDPPALLSRDHFGGATTMTHPHCEKISLWLPPLGGSRAPAASFRLKAEATRCLPLVASGFSRKCDAPTDFRLKAEATRAVCRGRSRISSQAL